MDEVLRDDVVPVVLAANRSGGLAVIYALGS
eukprot:COSAG05_NODE_6869_length_890_cov_1.083439_2_plen_30_part_01